MCREPTVLSRQTLHERSLKIVANARNAGDAALRRSRCRADVSQRSSSGWRCEVDLRKPGARRTVWPSMTSIEPVRL